MESSFWFLGMAVLAGAVVAPGQTVQSGGPLRLADGTEVQLRSTESVSSASARVGDKVRFQVMTDVRVNGVTVIPRESAAEVTVTVAQRKRRLGRGGQLDLSLGWVRLTDGERAPLRATETAAGESNGDGVTAGVVASAFTFLPAAPVFLLMHGQDATMPDGTNITAYIAGDVELDPANFPPPMDYRPTPALIPGAAFVAQAPPAPVQPDRSYPGVVTFAGR
jgi:hypothetical protein